MRRPCFLSIPGKFVSGPECHAFPGFLTAKPGGDMEAVITRPSDTSSKACKMAEDSIDARPDCGRMRCARTGLRKTGVLTFQFLVTICRMEQGTCEDQIN